MALSRLDVDAFPDTTPVQVQINTVAPALGPEEVERQITFPIEQGLSGLPGLEQLRSVSKFGLSQVVVLFRDGTDIYFARQVISERLAAVEMPAGVVRPKMGPVATGLGEVFHYIVEGHGTGPTELRTVQDWLIRPQMRTVPGAAEINSWGGYEKQYQIRIDPQRLIKHDLTFADVIEAVGKTTLTWGAATSAKPGACCSCRAWAAPPGSSRCGRSSSGPRGAFPFGSPTWPRSRSGTKSAAGLSRPTARARSCSASASF